MTRASEQTASQERGGGSIDTPRDQQVAVSIFTLTEEHQPLCKSSLTQFAFGL